MAWTARERLGKLRLQILRERKDVQTAMVTFVISTCAGWLLLGLTLDQTFTSPPAFGAHLPPWTIVLYCCFLAAILAPAWLLPAWYARVWRRQLARISGLLRQTEAGQQLLSLEYWDGVNELLKTKWWLQTTAAPRPITLERHLEFASCHWRALYSLYFGQRDLVRAVRPGGVSQLFAKPLWVLYGYSPVFALACFLIPFVFVVMWFFALPLIAYFLYLTTCYIQNHAAQLALIDFLLE